MGSIVHAGFDPRALSAPSQEALSFHRALPGYAPTPLRDLPSVAAGLGLARVALKDESDRLGLPAFKVLGASWAVERALREDPRVHTLVAASAGNHGRAVAHVAAQRGLAARVHLPVRASARAARGDRRGGRGGRRGRRQLRGRGRAGARRRRGGRRAARSPTSARPVPPRWVIDGYATLFAEIDERVRRRVRADRRRLARGGGRALGGGVRDARRRRRARDGGVPDRVARRRPADARRDARHGMAGLDCAEVSASRRGRRCGPASAAPSPSATRRRTRDARARRPGAADRRLRRRRPGRAALLAVAELLGDACCSSPQRGRRTPTRTRRRWRADAPIRRSGDPQGARARMRGEIPCHAPGGA